MKFLWIFYTLLFYFPFVNGALPKVSSHRVLQQAGSQSPLKQTGSQHAQKPADPQPTPKPPDPQPIPKPADPQPAPKPIDLQSVPKQVSSLYLMHKVFSKVELGEKTGLILGEKKINIRGVKYPYNASIVKHEDHYLLAFRYDVLLKPDKKPHPDIRFITKIGIVELDENFEQTEEDYFIINTGSEYSEDSRIFYLNGELHLIYNDVISPSFPGKERVMYLAKLNEDDFSIDYITSLDQYIKPVEKNWVPIVHPSPSGMERLLLGYSINPHKILGLVHPRSSELLHYIFPDFKRQYSLGHWTWGDPRGGTPARNMGDHYLAFFHSFFSTPDKEVKYWYVMGAYTFQAEEPFGLLSMSKEPIICSSLYSTKLDGSTADPCKRVAYPSGFVEGLHMGKEVFYVSIGENDCAVKVIIIDKDKLYEKLGKVN